MLIYDKKQVLTWHRWLLPAMLFTVIVLAGRLDMLLAALSGEEELSDGFALNFAIEALQSDAALLLAPVLCTFPYGAAMVDELRSGMVKGILSRVEKGRYLSSRALACMLAGGMESLASVCLLTGLSLALLAPLEMAPEQGMNQYKNIRLILGLGSRYGCYGALWSLVGLWISLLTMNRLMAWIGPFIVDYLLIIIYERYFDLIRLLYPKEWLLASWDWPLADAGICIWMLLLCGLLYLLVMYTGKKVLAHGL